MTRSKAEVDSIPSLALKGAIIFGSVVLAPLMMRPLLAADGKVTDTSPTGPPLLSLAEAQHRVTFPILVPRNLPRGHPTEVAFFVGARIDEPTSADPQPPVKTAAEASAQRPDGYGVMWSFEKNKVMVYALAGSPAQKAGLSMLKVHLVAINGQTISAKHEMKRYREFLSGIAKTGDQNAAKSRHAGKGADDSPPLSTNAPLAIQLRQRALKITVKSANGKTRQLIMPNTVESSRNLQPSGLVKANEVRLIYQMGRSKFTLVERLATEDNIKPPADAEKRVGWVKAEVWMFGRNKEFVPSAMWREGNLVVTLENTAGLDHEGVSMIIGSMHVPANIETFSTQ